MILNILSVAVFLVVFVLICLLSTGLFGGQRERQRERLEGEDLAAASSRGRRREVFGPLTEGLAGQIPYLSAELSHLDEDLRRAGHYQPTARREYLAVRNALCIGSLMLTAVLIVAAEPSNSRLTAGIAVGGALAACLGLSLPRLWLRVKGNQRVQRISKGLPDALDMITMCVAGGMSLQEALDRVGRELHPAHPDLAQELAIIRQQADLGTLEQALRQFSQRITAPEVKSLTALLIQSERLGTNVATALKDYADNARRTRSQRAEERTNRAGVKLLFPLVFCLAPSVFLLLLGPAVLEMRSFLVSQRRPGGALSQRDLSSLQTIPALEEAESEYRGDYRYDFPSSTDE